MADRAGERPRALRDDAREVAAGVDHGVEGPSVAQSHLELVGVHGTNILVHGDARLMERARRTLDRLGARKLQTRQAPVIFRSELAAGLLRNFVSAIRGSALYRQASFLLDALDTRVFPEWVRIEENPHLRRGLASAAFDSEGVATHRRDLVADGILRSYVLSTYSARKLGMQTTGNAGGVRNLSINTGEKDFGQLMRDMGTGLVVTELMGQGVNTITGDYSRGAAGFWVENGEIAYPVNECTVAGNLKDMLRTIVPAQDARHHLSRVVPSLLLEGLTIAGVAHRNQGRSDRRADVGSHDDRDRHPRGLDRIAADVVEAEACVGVAQRPVVGEAGLVAALARLRELLGSPGLPRVWMC